jgi:serine protease Do
MQNRRDHVPVAIGRRSFTRMLALGLPLFGSAACASRATREPGAVPDFVAVIGRVAPSVVAIGDSTQAVGSGFAVGPDLVITAAHVVKAAGAAPVVTSSRGRQTARIIGMHAESDVAVLSVSQALPPLSLAEMIPQVGEWIVVVGNPFGAGTTATVGIVSAAPGAIAATPALARQIQIDASVNPGNSGGPVCNLRGVVVGATTSLVANGQGIAFATSASVLRTFLTSLGK